MIRLPAILKAYEDFASLVDHLGFMPLSNCQVGYPSVSGLTDERDWHTNLDTDPWLWKTRIVDEGRAAYARLFDRKPGFISMGWYPVFLAARRRGFSFEDLYREGCLSYASKRIYLLFDEVPTLATHEIKALGGFGRESKSEYESAMTELQMSMFITVQGMSRMTSSSGEPHSWPATSYTTVEQWAPMEAMDDAALLDPDEALSRLVDRVLEVRPGADLSKATRLVAGGNATIRTA